MQQEDVRGLDRLLDYGTQHFILPPMLISGFTQPFVDCSYNAVYAM